MESILQTLCSQIEAIRSDLGAVRSDLGAVKSDLKSDLGAVKSDLGAVKSDLGAVKSDLGAVKSDLGAVQSDLSGQIEGISQRVQVFERMVQSSRTRNGDVLAPAATLLPAPICLAQCPSKTQPKDIAKMRVVRMPYTCSRVFAECVAAMNSRDTDSAVLQWAQNLANEVVLICTRGVVRGGFMLEKDSLDERFITMQLCSSLAAAFSQVQFECSAVALSPDGKGAQLRWGHQMPLSCKLSSDSVGSQSRSQSSAGKSSEQKPEAKKSADSVASGRPGYVDGIACVGNDFSFPVAFMEVKRSYFGDGTKTSSNPAFDQALCYLSYATNNLETKESPEWGGTYWIITLRQTVLDVYGVVVVPLPTDQKGDILLPPGASHWCSTYESVSEATSEKRFNVEVYGVVPMSSINLSEAGAKQELAAFFCGLRCGVQRLVYMRDAMLVSQGADAPLDSRCMMYHPWTGDESLGQDFRRPVLQPVDWKSKSNVWEGLRRLEGSISGDAASREKCIYKFIDARDQDYSSMLTAMKLAWGDEEFAARNVQLFQLPPHVQVLRYRFIEGNHKATSLQQLLCVALQLERLHSQGYVHGDVRVTNMVFNDDAGSLIDFDFCRVVSDSTRYCSGYSHHLEERHVDARANNCMRIEHDVYSMVYVCRKFFSGIPDSCHSCNSLSLLIDWMTTKIRGSGDGAAM